MQSRKGRKKVLKRITTDLKEMVAKPERGVCVTDEEYERAKSTISTILKNKEAADGANVENDGATMLNKVWTQVLGEVGRLFLV